MAGLFTTVGINAALASRDSSGLGTKIDVSMLDSQVAILENAIARYAATGSVPGPLGTRHPSITPFAAFAAKDAHVIIAAGNDALFRTLCTCLERPLLAEDSRFATNDLRTQHEAALRIELESALLQRTAATWLELLQQAGVPSGPINDVEQVLSDPQVRARNMLVRVEDPETGTQEMAGNPIKFSNHPDPETRGAVPALDGDRAAILPRAVTVGPGRGRPRPPTSAQAFGLRCARRSAALAGRSHAVVEALELQLEDGPYNLGTVLTYNLLPL